MNKKILISLILLLALVLRFWEFGNIPAGIYVDEAARGVNAYSLLKTGKDEYGKQFPVMMRSFGTYSSALYDYLTIVPVFFLGLNEVSVRLISLISGMLLVGFVIWQFGLLLGLIIAITPIFVFTSRIAYEPNLGLALLVIGSVLTFKTTRNAKLLLISFPILSLSAYGYHAERFLALIIILFLTVKFWKKLPRNIVLISLILALAIQIPIFLVSFTEGAYARLAGLSVEGTIIDRVLSFITLYIAYFSPDNLFSRPDPDPQRSFVDLSVFYWWMFIPFMFGILIFLKEKRWREINDQYFLVLLLFSPIIGALTKDYFSTFRVLPFFLTIAWIISLGLRLLVKSKYIYLLLVLISVLELYPNLVLLKHERSQNWNYEYKNLYEVLSNYNDKNIIIDSLKPVYILEAFYNQTDPLILHKRFNQQQLDNYYSLTNFDNNFRIKNIEYRSINWIDDVYKEQIIVVNLLAVSDTQAKEHKFKLLHEIPDINGEVVLRVFRTTPKEKCQNFDPQFAHIREACLKLLN